MLKKLEYYFEEIITPHTKLHEFYASNLFFAVVQGMNLIFIPYYLYTVGFTIPQILLYATTSSAIRLVCLHLIASPISYFGPQRARIVGLVLVVVFGMFLLNPVLSLWWLLAGLALLEGLSQALIFVTYGVYMSKVTDKKRAGSQNSKLAVIYAVGRIAGALVSAILAPINPLIAIGVAWGLTILSILPLIKMGEPIKVHRKISHRQAYRSALVDRRGLISYGANWSLDLMYMFTWPLFLALTVFANNPFAYVGYLTAVGIVLSVTFPLFIGRLIDHARSRQIIRLSSLCHVLLGLWRAVIVAPWAAIVHNLSLDLNKEAANSSVYVSAINKVKSKHVNLIEYWIVRESMQAAFQTVGFGLLLLSTIWFADDLSSLRVGSVAIGFLALLTLLASGPNKSEN